MRKLFSILLFFISLQSLAQIPDVVATTNYSVPADTTGAINDPYIIVDDAVTGTSGYEFNYAGATWVYTQNVAGWYPESGDPKQTMHYTNTTDDYVEFDFNGTDIGLYTQKKVTLGIFEVSIDGVVVDSIDLYAASPVEQVLVWDSGDGDDPDNEEGPLPQTTHRLKLRNTGLKNASATQDYLIIDYVRVVNPEEVPPLPPSPTYLHIEMAVNGGSDSNPCSIASPCLTIAYVNTIAVSGDTIHIGAGTFTENAYILPPLGVTYKGNGINQTIVKFNASLNHTFVPFDYGDDNYGFQFIVEGTGNQGIMDMTIQGNTITPVDNDNRGFHGGVYLYNTDNVDFTRVRFENFRFTAMNLRFSDNVDVIDCEIVNSSLSLSSFSSGALMFSTCNDLTIDNIFIDETTSGQVRGYGIKAFGPSPTQPVVDDLRIIDPFVLVTPISNFGTGGTANVAIEIHNVLLTDAQIIGGDINENISLVRPDGQADPGTNAITVDGLYMHPTAGYAMELTYHNVVIKNCYFSGGRYASIFQTAGTSHGPASTNWDIHHNVFYNPYTVGGQAGAIRSTNWGFANMEVYNNTFHWTASSSGVSCMVTFNGKNSSNIQFKNNLVWDQTNAAVMTLNGGGAVSASTFSYNQLFGLTEGALGGVTYSNNLTTNPLLSLSDPRPDPYYRITTGSPASESGTDVGLAFPGVLPSRGAYDIDPN